MEHGAGLTTPEPGRSRWTSPWAVVTYVVVGCLVVVGSFWTARAGRADPGAQPTPTGSPSATSPGTPRITIAMTPGWESAPQPALASGAELTAEPAGMVAPVVLGGSAAEGYARLDPSTGQWLWRRDTQSRTFLGWAGSIAVFGDPGATGRAATVFGVTPDGDRAFSTRAGRYVASTSTRVLLADGRNLTAITPTGAPAWTARLPAGVTVPGHVSDLADAAPGTPDAVAFVSSSGPGRVVTVDLVDGRLRPYGVAAAHPEAWSTAWGVVVADPSSGAVTRYDLSGSIAWSLQGGTDLLAVEGEWALVATAETRTVSLLRVEDGSTVFTSDPLDAPVAAGSITSSALGPVLADLRVTEGDATSSLAVAADPSTGDQLWAVEHRNLLGIWHGFALFGAEDGRDLSALDLHNGIAFATLNASAVVEPSTSAIVGSTLIYLDPARGTARAVALADRG